ncbi:FtsB family cell division protein [Eubacterium sp.]|uniref:FtsB family cell division protein n=1 Tax=uncultured Eubacterium sp. TaxID=165185 RepID=UPI0025EA8FF0|nr:septum formation initiator family protein [uncultured Eubacterium sp.]
MKAKNNKIKSKKSVIVGFVIAIIAALAVYCGTCLISNTADIARLKNESQELNTKYQQQLDENKKVKSILESDNKDEYIEQKAREKGYVKDGEVVYYDISSSK